MSARAAGYGLAAVLIAATLGEGGGHAISMLVWHALLVVLLLVATLWPRTVREIGRGPAPAPLVPFALFLLLFAAGMARAPHTYAALLVAIELACCVAAGWIASRHGPPLLEQVVTPLQVAAAAHGGWVIVQWARGAGLRPAGTFLNPNHMSLWLVAVTLLAVGTGLARRRSVPWRVGLLALPAALATVLAGSRGALLALAAGACWLLWSQRRRIPRPFLVGLVAAVLLVLGGIAWRQQARIDRFDPFRYHRFSIWRACADAVAADPWWGTGPGQFPTAAAGLRFADGDGPLRYDRVFSATHSDPLRLPVELGLPAAAAALAAFLLALGFLARRRREGSPTAARDGALAALIAIATQAVFDNPSAWPAVHLLAAVLAGAVLSERRAHRVPLDLRTRAALAATAVVLFLAADLAPFLAWNAARGLPGGALGARDHARLLRVIDWNPLHPDYPARLAGHLVASGASWNLETYAAAREAAERAARLHPRSARHRRAAVDVEARACRTLFPDVACRERTAAGYREVERLSPHDPFLPAARAAFLMDTGDAEGARRAAERALGLEPESVLPRLLLADAFLESGSAADRRRAAALLADARERAERFAGWNDSSYGAELLDPDPAILERLERKLRPAAGDPGEGRPRTRDATGPDADRVRRARSERPSEAPPARRR